MSIRSDKESALRPGRLERIFLVIIIVLYLLILSPVIICVSLWAGIKEYREEVKGRKWDQEEKTAT